MANTLVEDSAVQIPTRMVFDKKRYMRVLLLEAAVARECSLLEGDVTPKGSLSKVLSLESDATWEWCYPLIVANPCLWLLMRCRLSFFSLAELLTGLAKGKRLGQRCPGSVPTSTQAVPRGGALALQPFAFYSCSMILKYTHENFWSSIRPSITFRIFFLKSPKLEELRALALETDRAERGRDGAFQHVQSEWWFHEKRKVEL